MLTIPKLFEETVQAYPEKMALWQPDNNITFSDLFDQVKATAHVLTELGIGKGDRVAVCMGKGIDQALAILGIMYANAVFVPILPKLKRHNIEHIVKDSGLKALITDQTRLGEVAFFKNETQIIIGAGETVDDLPCLPYMRKHLKGDKVRFTCIGTDNAAIIYSSGSTGRPKGIVISHRNLADGALIVSQYTGTVHDDRIACVLSLNFDYGLNQLWQTLYKGASLYFHDLLFPKDLFDMLSKKKITSLPLMPVIMTRMFDPRFYKPDETHDFSCLRFVTTSGGPVSSKMLENLKKTFPAAEIFLMYGLTEAFRSSFLPPDQLEKRPRSIGKAIPDVELYVVDEHLNICKPGEHGQLIHRGGCMSKGYWNDLEKTKETFREISLFPGEKVLFSGDTVTTDDEGFVYFIARGDSMIKTHGYRVSPTEIEEEAVEYENVTATVAFGTANIEIGQDIILVYETDDGKPCNDKLFMNFLKLVLPKYMVPARLIHFERFKSTGNEGKVDRVWVREKALEMLNMNADK